MDFKLPERSEMGPLFLAVARILIGFMLVWGFFDKLFGLGFETPSGCGWINGVSPSSFVNYASGGVFADFFRSIGGNVAVDVLFMAGLLCIGVALILGIASKITTVCACLLLIVLYSLYVPPKDNPLIDFRIVFVFVVLALYYTDGFDRYSLGMWWKNTWLVRKFPVLS